MDRQDFYACIRNKNGRILKKVSNLLSQSEAEQLLKTEYKNLWLNCEAIPKHKNTIGLHD